MTATPSFIVYALPRSRTAWLAEFLTYADWFCLHEQAIYMRSIDDVKDLFSRSNTGTVETAAAQGWWIVRHHVPNIRIAVIRRPVEDVVRSMLAVDLEGVGTYDETKLRAIMRYGDRMLAQISREPGVLTLDCADLDTEDGCAAIFEHCLPYRFDSGWWNWLKDRNIQVNVADVIRYYHANRADIDGFKSLCKRELIRLCRDGVVGRCQMELASA